MNTLLYDITHRCNLKCNHCYNSDYFLEEINSEEVVDYVIEFIFRHNISHVHILGGEPFLSNKLWHFIDSISDIASVSINTNGTLLHKENALKILSRKNINQITVSLDGHDEESNSIVRGKNVFNKVLENITLFNSLKSEKGSTLKMNLAFVVFHENMNSLPSLPLIAKENGFNRIMVSFLYHEGLAKLNYRFGYDYDTLLRNLLQMIKKSKNLGVEIMLDVKPIFLKMLEIRLNEPGISLGIEASNCYVNFGYRYISASGKLYPCGPSSKLGKEYLLYDLMKCDYAHEFSSIDIFTEDAIFNEDNENFCGKCPFNNICSPCPLNIPCNSYEMCGYAIKKILNDFDKIGSNKIMISDDYLINQSGGKLYIINFKLKVKFFLCDVIENIIDSESIYKKPLLNLSQKIDSNTKKWDFIFNLLSAVNKGLLLLS